MKLNELIKKLQEQLEHFDGDKCDVYIQHRYEGMSLSVGSDAQVEIEGGEHTIQVIDENEICINMEISDYDFVTIQKRKFNEK